MEDLIQELSKYGEVQICKAHVVFTLLMTGEGLSKLTTVDAIQMAVHNKIGAYYPVVEAYKNDDNFLCMVLKSL